MVGPPVGGDPPIVVCRACGRSVVNNAVLLGAHLDGCRRAVLPSTLHNPKEAGQPLPRSGRKPDLHDYDSWDEELT